MNNALNIFHKILFLELRPWSIKGLSDAKFIELTHQVKKEFYSFQPLYQVVFPKPLTVRRKYYHALIENEAIRYLNEFHQDMSAALNDEEKKYLVFNVLNNVLIPKLKKNSAIIEEHQYFFTNLAVPSISKTNNNLSDNSFALQFLKYQLIRIYLEIQDSYQDSVEEDILSEADIHQLYFSESTPEKSFIQESPKIKTQGLEIKLTKNLPSNLFNPRKGDFRPEKKGILSFKTMIKNPDRFLRFEEELFDHGLINEDYNFSDRHTQKQELAAIYQTLIKKGYFQKRDFQKLTDIKHIEIRKFLDYRYNADLDKQFRSWENDPDGLANYVQNRYWLDKLPTC